MSNYNGNLTSGTSDESDSGDERRHVPGNQWLQRPPRSLRNNRPKKSVRIQLPELVDDDSEDDIDTRPTLRRQKSYNKNRGYSKHRSSSHRSGRTNDLVVRPPTRSLSRHISATKYSESNKKEQRKKSGDPYGTSNVTPSRRSVSFQRTINHAGEVKSIPRPYIRRYSSQRSQPRRISSLPGTSARKNSHPSPSPAAKSRTAVIKPPRSEQKQQQENPKQPKRHQSTFVPKRSKSIHRAFQHQSQVSRGGMNDIWIERIILGGPSDNRKFFKSVLTGEVRVEPPTGATNVVYLDDIVQRRTSRPEISESIKSSVRLFGGPTLRASSVAIQPNERNDGKEKKKGGLLSLFRRTQKVKKENRS